VRFSDLDRKVQARELSWKSAANVWTLLVSIFKDARGNKDKSLVVRKDNPCTDVLGPDTGVKRARSYLYPTEFLTFISSPDVPLVWRCRVALAVYLFPRAAELEALEWNDVDIERGIVHIHRAIDRAHGGMKPTKAGVTRRFSVEPNLLPLLRALHGAAGGVGRVVSMPHEVNLARDLRLYLRRAGVTRAELFADDETRKPLGFHDLRATGLTWMAIRGDSPHVIKQRAGHTDFKTTELYVREGEAVAAGFGDVFPALPEAFIEAQSSSIVPVNRPRRRNRSESLCRRWDSNPQAIADNGF
jgi:integrase